MLLRTFTAGLLLLFLNTANAETLTRIFHDHPKGGYPGNREGRRGNN